VSYNEYGGYCVPRSSIHRDAAKKILSNDVYEPETIQFMISNFNHGDIVHAGTYFGDFLPALSSACPTGSKIWAFEPNIENYRCAGITLNINNITNVVLANDGLGAHSSILPIIVSDDKGLPLGGGSSFLSHGIEDAQSELANIVAIDDVVDSNRLVSVIQLDVEGYEKEALIGALETINRWKPIIILEVLPDSTLVNSEWFFCNILSIGYSITKQLHGNLVFEYEI
jgi:FkbM family methyltransferase